MKKRGAVGIVGLGHVGSQTSAMLAAGGCDVVHYDLKVHDVYPREEFESAVAVFVCVDTPNMEDGNQDLSALENAVASIPPGPTIVLRSTIVPGTTARLAAAAQRPILHWPEFYGETAYANQYWPDSSQQVPFVIFGGPQEVRESVLGFLSPVLGPYCTVFSCSSTESELIKYMENAFLATKVAFVNEFFSMASMLGADWNIVREGWLHDPRISRSHTSVFPDDRGFGGRCLPKDLQALRSFLAREGFEAPLLTGLNESNELSKQRDD